MGYKARIAPGLPNLSRASTIRSSSDGLVQFSVKSYVRQGIKKVITFIHRSFEDGSALLIGVCVFPFARAHAHSTRLHFVFLCLYRSVTMSILTQHGGSAALLCLLTLSPSGLVLVCLTWQQMFLK